MDKHYPRTHISPHTMSKPGRPAVKHSNMVASKASPKASGPGKALGVLATEVDAQEHEAPEPQAGLLKGDFCHQPRDLLCGPMGDAFNLVRQAIALDNRGRLRSLFGIPLADAICVRSHARRSCSSAASDSRCIWRSSAIAVYATRNTCVRWSRVCPRQTRTNSCATIVSFRSLPSQNHIPSQNTRCCHSPRLRGISESWAVRPLWSPVADCEAWVTYGALAKIGQ